MYTNADTITNKFAELQILITIHDPAVIAVAEVKPKNPKAPLTKAGLKIKDFELIANTNCFNNQGRGVCIYVHESLYKHCTESNRMMVLNQFGSTLLKKKTC